MLANRPLREDTRLESISRSTDVTWDLTPAIVQRHGRRLTLNVDTVQRYFRGTVKELFLASRSVMSPEFGAKARDQALASKH